MATATVAATWAAKTELGGDVLLAHAPLSAPLDEGDAATSAVGAPPSGATVPTRASAATAAATTTAPMSEDPPRWRWRAHGRCAKCCDRDTAGPDPCGDQERPPEAGQLDQRAAGLAQEDPTERQPAERPRHSGGLGQSAGTDEGEARARAAGGVAPAAAAKKRASSEDEDDGAVPVEGSGPDQPDGVAAQTGQPAGPDPGPQAQPGQAPVEERGTDEPQGPPAPRGEGEREEDSRRDRGAWRHGPGAAGRSQERARRGPAAGDAGGYADTAVGRARDGDTAEAGQRRLDAGGPQQVVHPVLGKASSKRVTTRADRG